jgi:hypothetical protein
VIHGYELGAVQLISQAKCSIMFGSDVSQEDQDRVKSKLNVDIVAAEEKYLGLPTPEGRMSKDQFKSTKDRLAKTCSSWAERYMSGGAKEVLIKSVAQAILTYVMGVFKLLATL